MARRSKAREVALQLLYQFDLNSEIDQEYVRSTVQERLSGNSLREFALQLFEGVKDSRKELDELIVKVAENWDLSRMSPTDRNTIRLGAFELTSTDTPRQIVINEAVELAKRYGAKQSPQFVNGILDKLEVSDKPASEQSDNSDDVAIASE